ncbi:MAG: hypothetical protein JW963_12850 [Anaerolineales bacterium]|nr:hypothetical protein [Anaerolineales bacterium]
MDKSMTWKRLGRSALIVLLLLLLIPLIYCCGIPLITRQICYDHLSGHVPPKALNRFLDRAFEAISEKDYTFLATISTPEVLEEAKEVQPVVTNDYEILLRDNLLGLYAYRVRFDSGATVYITLDGEWHACPDFIVTEEEIFQNIKLTSIEIEAK